MEKTLTNSEKITAERKKVETEYLESQQDMLNVRRIIREGIQNSEDLIQYLVACIEDAEHMEDMARANNNYIMYSECVGIRREFTKLLKLSIMPPKEETEGDGTEKTHRANNKGEEGYA